MTRTITLALIATLLALGLAQFAEPAAAEARTPCTKVAVIGDSKSEKRIGARQVIIDELRRRGMPYFLSVSSGRTIQHAGFGTDKRHGNTISAVGYAKRAGANCFVIAVGGNDAMRARGDHARMRRDIDVLMSAIGREYTVDWVTSTSNHHTGRWSMHTLHQFTVELDRARGRWGNLEINHWERVTSIDPFWWRADSLHYNHGNIPRGVYTVDSAFIRGNR